MFVYSCLYASTLTAILFSERVEDAPKETGMSGIKLFLVMLVIALVLIACVVVGIMVYQKHQENSRKRFY